jgi:multidrug efflux pump subunit AcrB
LEQWVSTVSRVKQIKSISQEGMSIIMVEFESGTNLDFAAQDVREKIGILEAFLPEGADSPLVVKFNFEDMPIKTSCLTSCLAPFSLPIDEFLFHTRREILYRKCCPGHPGNRKRFDRELSLNYE